MERGSEMLRMTKSQSARTVTTLFLLLGLSLLSGCAGLGGSSSNTPSSAVEVSPASANVRAGDTLQFSAKVSGVMDQSVAWSVNGTVGGNATVGKISSNGLYTSPAALPTPNSVTIEATSASNKSLSGSSAISLENPIPTVTAVSPTAVPVGNFSLTITGTKFVSGAKVMFGGQTLTTKLVSATELTATGTATTSQKGVSVQVTVANPDPGAMTSSAVMVKVGAIAVTLSPSTANLFPGQSLQFKATVTGTTNQAVTWQVNGAVGGATNVGTISTSGLYTAPETWQSKIPAFN